MDNSSAQMLVAQGDAARAGGAFADALAAYDAALAAELSCLPAHIGRACALIELKRYTDAIASCGHALALAPQDAYVYNLLGFALMSLDYFAEAVVNYDHALALAPDSVRPERFEQAAREGAAGGTRGDPRAASALLGQHGARLIVDATVAAIRAALSSPR